MAEQWQLRHGTATENDDFTGAEGEVTVDMTNKTLRVHDGITTGGTTLAKQETLDNIDYVIQWQNPTAANNYTWYRKYKSGWVEQGGFQAGNGTYDAVTITLPVTMSNAYYYANATIDWTYSTWYTDSTMTIPAPAGTDINGNICDKTASGFKIQGFSNHVWEVKGIAA